MVKFIPLILLLFSASLLGCSEDENTDSSGSETRFKADSVTCDDAATSIGLVQYAITLDSSSAIQIDLSGYTTTPTACIGVYPVSSSTFDEDGSFSYTRPDAATACADINGDTVSSCDVSGVSCTTTSSDPAVSTSGTYTQSSTELVLTYTANGNSFCSTGETEVLTMTVNAE